MREDTNIPEATMRMFFAEFCEVGSTLMADMFIKMPKSVEGLRQCEIAYRIAGFPGCIASVDGVRIKLWNCPYAVQKEYTGKEGFPTLTFLVAASYDGKVIYCSEPYAGSYPDIRLAEDDALFQTFRNDTLYTQYEWNHVRKNGEV
jgi:hypothetical protein